MPTDKQRSASRRNGRLSSGPKTAPGKKAASLNALRHGLSAQTSLHALNPNLDKIKELILGEVGDPSFARQIADKILDYERTEGYQSQVAAKEAEGKDGFLNKEALKKQQVESMATAMWRGQMVKDLEQPGLTKHKKEELRVYRDALKFLTKMSVRQETILVADAQQESMRLRRYYKRASNQLIKAIKAIANA